jgi:hypothetical protein
MQYVCDAPDGKTWFRIETVEEAAKESALMNHAVEKHFRQQWDTAATSFKPASTVYIEQNIGLKSHVQREMPLFLTLRNSDGDGLATAMLPPTGKDKSGFRIIIVGPGNSDPYTEHDSAIRALGTHFGITLDRDSCYPYQR